MTPWCVVLCVRCPGRLGSCSPMCRLGALLCVCGVLGHLAPVRRCARVVCCVACAVSLATWLLSTGVPARCVALLVRCPRPLGSCSPVCPRCVLYCAYGVPGHLPPVHQCARSVCCFAGAVSSATWLLFTGVPALCIVLRVWCPGPLAPCSPVRLLSVLLCWCGVLGHLAPVHRCARSVCSFACTVFSATWLLFSGAPPGCVVLGVRCPGLLGSCSPVCALCRLLCLCGVLGHLAPVHGCARSVRCVARAASRATWLLFTVVCARCVVLRVRCPVPLCSCSRVCPALPLLCLCGVLGHLAPVHRCARSVLCFPCAVSWATWPLFTRVPAPCVVLRVWCPGPHGSSSPLCPLCVWLRWCGVLSHWAPVHRCSRSVCGVACTLSWAPWLLFTGVLARCALLGVRCLGPRSSCSPLCPLCVFCCVCGALGHLAPVHRCARSVCCVACTVSWAPWLLLTGVLARCAVLGVRCPGPLASCSPVCSLGSVVLWVACAVLRVRGAHSSIRTAAVCSRQGLGTLRARTPPSGGRLFRSRQGLSTHQARTRPSGRRLFRSQQGLGLLPGAHTSVRTVAGVAWHLFSCCGSVRVVRALRVCGGRQPLLLGTCPCALLVACGLPLWRASWPRLVRRASWGPVALGAPVGFREAVVPVPGPGAGSPGFTGWLRGACGSPPRTRLIVLAADPRRRGGAGFAPRCTCSWPRDGVVPGVSLWRRSRAACAAVVGVCEPGH